MRIRLLKAELTVQTIRTCTNVAMKLSGENPYQGSSSVSPEIASTAHHTISTVTSIGATTLEGKGQRSKCIIIFICFQNVEIKAFPLIHNVNPQTIPIISTANPSGWRDERGQCSKVKGQHVYF